MEKSTRLDRLDQLVDDFSINSTWPIFDWLHRSTTGSNIYHPAKFYPNGIRGFISEHARLCPLNCLQGYFWRVLPLIYAKYVKRPLFGVTNSKFDIYALFQKNCNFAARFRRHLSPVYTIQPVVKPVWQLVKCLYTRHNRLSNWLSNRFENRLYRVYKHSTSCQTSLTTGLSNRLYNSVWQPVEQLGLTTDWTNSGCSFNTVVKPVVEPSWQPVASCKRGLRNLRVKTALTFDVLPVNGP